MVPTLAVSLLAFAATRAGRRQKERLGTAEARRGRSASQVAANLGMAALVASGPVQFWLMDSGWFARAARTPGLGFVLALAALAEAAADTVSSEIGQVLGGRPRMITTLRAVEPGRDGAVSVAGTLAGAVAAAVVAGAGSWALRGGWNLFELSCAGADLRAVLRQSAGRHAGGARLAQQRRGELSVHSERAGVCSGCTGLASAFLDTVKGDSAMDIIPLFDRYVGIDYSGAETPTSSLKGLRVYIADRLLKPSGVPPPAGHRRYWSRCGIAEWLAELFAEDIPTLVGIDHGFSFPLRYFEKYGLPLDWATFLEDFQRHWPTDENIYVDFVRDGICGDGAARTGETNWRRITEIRARGAKSVFHFDVPGSVAKSTHCGLPWLRYLRLRRGGNIHFWPFDGWLVPTGRSAVAEVYPALWNRSFPQEERDGHQHDAYSITAWLRRADSDGSLPGYFRFQMEERDRFAAEIEGWILGVV